MGSTQSVFTAKIRLDKGDRAIRPGMTAKALISITERDDSLTVPASAVLRTGGKDHVAVKKPEGGFEWREVVLGEASGPAIEVKRGLDSFDQVAIDPLLLVRRGMNRQEHAETVKSK